MNNKLMCVNNKYINAIKILRYDWSFWSSAVLIVNPPLCLRFCNPDNCIRMIPKRTVASDSCEISAVQSSNILFYLVSSSPNNFIF